MAHPDARNPSRPEQDAIVDLALTVDDDRWRETLGDDPDSLVLPVIEAAIAAGRTQRDAGREVSLGVTFSDDEAVRILNRDYRGRDSATNVLSFAIRDGEETPLPEDAPVELGDLVLAYETIFREADLQERPARHHLLHLIAHGTLHLLGYDHTTDAEADAMERLEIDILARFSIPNPYEEDIPSVDRTDGTP